MTVKVKVPDAKEPMPDSIELEGTASTLVCSLVEACIRNLPADCTVAESPTSS